MPAPENPKVGGCYIWVISFLLFVFTVSGAVFLLLYVTQPASVTTSRYAIVGVALVFLPWVFWLLTFFYRVLSRNCGFRMICFGSGYPDNDKNAPAMRSNSVSNNAVSIPIGHNGPAGDQENNAGTENENLNDNEHTNENGNGNADREPTSPRRVHFGGVVILGEDENGNTIENQGSPQAVSRSSSASSSSSSSRHSNESETPLRLSMA